jgi:hypothetical protein
MAKKSVGKYDAKNICVIAVIEKYAKTAALPTPSKPRWPLASRTKPGSDAAANLAILPARNPHRRFRAENPPGRNRGISAVSAQKKAPPANHRQRRKPKQLFVSYHIPPQPVKEDKHHVSKITAFSCTVWETCSGPV